MLARVLLTAVAVLAACAADTYALTIVTRGEAFQAAIGEAYVQPFIAATDIPVHQELWDGGLDALRAKPGENGWDLVQVDADELSVGCNEGLYEKLDWPAVGGREHYQQIGVTDCGVGATGNSVVLAWDRDKLSATPTWADFWDVAKIPGKRGLAKQVRGALEFALMADGVAPGDVYKTLGTNEGVDRAFRKLDQLKPYIVWWQTPADAGRNLGSGDVLMSAAPSSVVATANRADKRNFGIQFAGGLLDPRYWAIVKGSQNPREALQFLYLTGAPSVQARLFRISGDIGLAKGVNDWLTPEQQAMSPTFAANAVGLLRIDNGFWHDNLAKLRARFEAWLAQ
jgi:putative spermidine/putrescine transport system substrate-binding protein